ncbi:MAG: DUF488 family protein, partial [Acidimicrobiales bacterium]
SSAQHFFERLNRAGVRRLVDIRLNNVSQLAGFAKAADLAYFLDAICSVTYEHEVRLAPTQDLLKAYRDNEIGWSEYESDFRNLMIERNIPAVLEREAYQAKTALLCSEADPEQCHRRLVGELLTASWRAKVEHL